MFSLTLNVFVHYPADQVKLNFIILAITYVKIPNTNLYLRGNNMGLSWNAGVLLQQTNQNQWSTTLTYSQSVVNTMYVIVRTHNLLRLEMKVLVDDQIWAIGANVEVLVPGVSSDVDLYPFFYSTQGS